jgi:hypothetical protein
MLISNRSRDSSIVQPWPVEKIIGGSSTGRGWEFLFSPVSRSAVGPTQPPIQCVSEALFVGGKAAGA